MIDKDKINRINELAKKMKEEGLTEEEAAERKALHKEYIEAVRNNLRAQLNSIKIIDPFADDDVENFTEEERENFEFLSEKLAKELEEQNLRDEQLKNTINGNPSKPVGEAGEKMLERMNNSHLGLTNWGLDFVSNLDPKTILDIGCGGGAAIANLHNRYPDATIYGIDISDVSIEKTLEVNREAVVEDKVRVTEGSVENLPYGDDFFDLIITVETYYFWPDFQKNLDQVKRVLKPNGTVLLLAEMYDGYKLNKTEEFLKDKFSHNLYSPKEFKDMFEKAGFKDIIVHINEDKHHIAIEAKK